MLMLLRRRYHCGDPMTMLGTDADADTDANAVAGSHRAQFLDGGGVRLLVTLETTSVFSNCANLVLDNNPLTD